MSEKKVSKVAAIKEYFQMSASEAMAELKALSPAEKLELAQGAAQNMGLTQEQCSFELA